MAQTLENIKRGGGSIKVGAVGTISALMTRELESANSTPQAQSSSRSKLQTAPVSVPCGATPRRLQARRSLDEASSSGKRADNLSPEAPRKSKGYPGSSRQVPMLGSDSVSLDRTTSREKNEQEGASTGRHCGHKMR
ncbi:unnamed protein product [Rhodiola kirilowii]